METRTFLFTDIEDSTGHFERAGAQYTSAAGEHFAALEAAIAEHNGELFRNTGDGLLAAFCDPMPALRCARECQRKLRSIHWPEATGELRVRIGLHRGDVVRDGGDFHGLTMHHATRVLNAAHGGQIICSASLLDGLPLDAHGLLRDLGLYRLRGVSAPVRLFEVNYEGMPSCGFPPLRTPPAFTHHIEAPPSAIFGREREIEELCAMLAPVAATERGWGRLVTLHGPGGVGKTRLSLAVAARMLPAYSHAVWFVPLAELRDARLLPDTLRAALGATSPLGPSVFDQVTEILGAQPSLLILDNFEQLVPDGVAVVRALIERLPALAVLASSRVRLGLSAERDFGLVPLSLPDASAPFDRLRAEPAVRLYSERAQAVRRNFQLTPENAPDVARLCTALEGMPLAIELAAARAKIVTPGQTLTLLKGALDFFGTRDADVPGRHRTLRAAFDWSYELLSEPLRRWFARLSVFRGGWSIEAAQALDDDAASAVGALDELAACSLISTEETPRGMRYRMLAVLREYASERLGANGEAPEMMRRHALFFHALACGAIRGVAIDEASRLSLFDEELENMRAVLASDAPACDRADLAVALRSFWMIRGHLDEGRGCIARLLDEVNEPVRRASLANAAGILAWKAADLADARRQFESALPCWKAAGRESDAAGTLNNLGIVADEVGDYAGARARYGGALEIYRRLALPSRIGAVLSNIAASLLKSGEPAAAEAPLLEALGIQRQLGEQFNGANTLHNLAEMRCDLGDFAGARRAFAECLRMRTALGSREDLGASFSTLARIALGEHRHALAAALFAAMQRALEELEPQQSDATRARDEEEIANLRELLGDEGFARARQAARGVRIETMLGADGEWTVDWIEK
jgi:predicted ATPase